MKANEAPEKIYVDSKAIGDNISTTVRITPQDYPTCTEYTRTDAFIEKAAKWINDNAVKWAANIRVHGHKVTELMNEDFKKYMKGE